jgi:hypothetical protein
MDELEAQFRALWQDALDQYATTSGKHLDEAGIPKLDTVQSLLAQIDARHQQFSEFRKSRQKLFQALDMALKPIQLISNMAVGVTNQVSINSSSNDICAV